MEPRTKPKHSRSDVPLFEIKKEFLTTAEVAGLLRLSERAVRGYVSRGEIPYRRLGGRWLRFSALEITAWLRDKGAG